MSPIDGGKKTVYKPAPNTVEEFLAHAVTLETEVAERYEEIANAMDVHNNREVAELFHKLARASHKHAAEMRTRSEGKQLPKLMPWDFQWGDEDAPETLRMGETHYLMTPYHALSLARRAEIDAQGYYMSVAEGTKNADVRALAQECAYEEAEHVDLVNKLIQRYPKPDDGWDFDPDSPATPA